MPGENYPHFIKLEKKLLYFLILQMLLLQEQLLKPVTSLNKGSLT